MKRSRNFAAIGGLIFLLILVTGISLSIGWRPFIGPSARPLDNRKFEPTAARLERGKYLTHAVAGCADCHSPHDWSQHDAPVPEGREFAGQDFSILKGLPGHIVAPNLTPDAETGAGQWSDDTLARAIREGIGHDGRALFPFMPYEHFRSLSDEDLASIIVYLRSVPAVRNALPKTEIIFPVKYLIRSVPQPLTAPVAPPDISDPVKRGAFLVNLAACGECHTPQVRGQPIQGMNFAGGLMFDGPWGKVASANLTPDPSGIPHYDETRFVETMRTGYVGARKLSQIMPWHAFRNMTDEDLKSIFAYLRTLPPVSHRVDNTEAPTFCPIDKSTHGAGQMNGQKG